jgi:hypothetical protein
VVSTWSFQRSQEADDANIVQYGHCAALDYLMSRSLRIGLTKMTRRVRACTFESMPLETDPKILSAVETVYSTDLGLPEDWTDAQRSLFIADEAEVITWMVCAEAGTLGDRSVQEWTRRSGGRAPDHAERTVLMAEARRQALERVLHTQLYEQVSPEP